LCGLPVVVVRLEAPGIIQRGRGFPIRVDRGIGIGIITGLRVIAQGIPDPSIDQAVRLEFMDEVDEGPALLNRNPARRIEPDQTDWAIVGEQFTYLRLDVVLGIAREVLALLDEIPV